MGPLFLFFLLFFSRFLFFLAFDFSHFLFISPFFLVFNVSYFFISSEEKSVFFSFFGVGLRGALCAASALAVFCPRGFVQVAPLTSLSAHRQCHGDGLLLVTPLSTQPPLPPPPRGAPGVASSHALLPAKVHPLKHHQTHVRGQAWVRRLFVVVVCCCNVSVHTTLRTNWQPRCRVTWE